MSHKFFGSRGVLFSAEAERLLAWAGRGGDSLLGEYSTVAGKEEDDGKGRVYM